VGGGGEWGVAGRDGITRALASGGEGTPSCTTDCTRSR
jgi:hypothetical protein